MNDNIVNAFTQTENNLNLEIDNLNVGCITSKNNNFDLDSEGNLTVKTITTTGQSSNTPSNAPSLDSIYPVGSIYMSVNSNNPSTLFGGTWTQIKDRFLLSCGDVYANGSTGGASAVTLGVNNIPSHSHSFSGTTSSNGNHSHTGNTLELRQTNSYNYSNDAARPISSSASHYGLQITNDAGAHQHTFSGTTGATGSGQAHDNMPPYLAVYVWKRTA